MARSSLLLLALCLSASLQAAPLVLDDLLAGAPPAPAERRFAAELEAQAAAIEQRRAEAGWQLFGSAALGSYHELGELEQRNDYYGRNLAFGVRHPLLGSLHRRLAPVQAGLGEQERHSLRLALAQAEQHLQLRIAYADWWLAQEARQLCRLLAHAATTALRALQARRQAGWMLASEADALRSRWRVLQRHCAGAEEQQWQAAQWLGELAGREIAPQHSSRAEPLASRPQPLAAWLGELERHPRLAVRHSRLDEAAQQRKLPWYALLESSISLSRDFERRSDSGQTGGNWVASLDVSAPLDLLGYGAARRREGEARLRVAEAELDAERHGLRRDLAALLRSHRQTLEAVHRQGDLLRVVRRRLAERRLRIAVEGEAGVARLREAELEVYETSLQLIAAWHALWLDEAALRLFADDAGAQLLGDAREHLGAVVGNRNSESKSESTEWRQGVYVWDSRALLDPGRRAGELRALRGAGMQRLYLGLSAAQVARLNELRPALQTLLEEVRSAGMEPLLLLGEPDWLRPERRGRLAELLGRLADLPFAGLHLDLEVEQLGWPVPEQRLRDWLDTLELAVRSSPWPVELSSHHRWFAADAGSPCVPCALPGLGVRQISLMIYTANVERSADLAGDIARRWPALRFRLAQSVEPQLPASESLAGRSRAELQGQVRQWQSRLQPAALGGIDWQAWQYYPR